MRNPSWKRDELIITLQFYLTHAPSIPGKTSPEISELSELLNSLQSKMGGPTPDKFRNPNAVYMKLMNFRRFDPEYPGKGLQRGNKDEAVVWELYSSNRDELKRVCDNICSFISSEETIFPKGATSSDEEEGQEGQILTRVHRYRERDTRLVRLKKKKVLRERRALICEVCGFDFEAVYSGRGHGFIECHHTKPLSELKLGETTTISDLSLVCSNCHRMIHNKRPWLSVDELRRLINWVTLPVR